MANCPGCGAPAVLDLANDSEGRTWHRTCLELKAKAHDPSLSRPQTLEEQDRLLRDSRRIRSTLQRLKLSTTERFRGPREP